MRRTEAALLAVALFAALGTGCMGYRTYHDSAADRYNAVLHADRGEGPAPTEKSVRFALNVVAYVGGELAEPVSTRHEAIEKLARRTICDMGIFKPENVGDSVERPDYQFIFDVQIETTREPGVFSGLILPFFRTRQRIVRLQVLDERGQPFASYTAASETFQARHVLLFWLTPFYWPGQAERNARRDVFKALAVKLITDREEFL